MSVPKYKKQYEEMLKRDQKLFDELKNTKRGTDKFREIQREVIRIVRRNEDMLCSKTESTRHYNFSASLADKFMEEVRANYPEIDYS